MVHMGAPDTWQSMAGAPEQNFAEWFLTPFVFV